MENNLISEEEAKTLVERCLTIGMSEDAAKGRCLDVAYVIRATGIEFEAADHLCLDTVPGWTSNAGFQTGWEMCAKLVASNLAKRK